MLLQMNCELVLQISSLGIHIEICTHHFNPYLLLLTYIPQLRTRPIKKQREESSRKKQQRERAEA